MDKYDKAIEYFTENPEQISKVWVDPLMHESGCLFAFTDRGVNNNSGHGCLTMIRMKFPYKCGIPEFTEQIRNDVRIPTDDRGINLGNLHVFAEWQRKIDEEYARREKTE